MTSNLLTALSKNFFRRLHFRQVGEYFFHNSTDVNQWRVRVRAHLNCTPFLSHFASPLPLGSQFWGPRGKDENTPLWKETPLDSRPRIYMEHQRIRLWFVMFPFSPCSAILSADMVYHGKFLRSCPFKWVCFLFKDYVALPLNLTGTPSLHMDAQNQGLRVTIGISPLASIFIFGGCGRDWSEVWERKISSLPVSRSTYWWWLSIGSADSILIFGCCVCVY